MNEIRSYIIGIFNEDLHKKKLPFEKSDFEYLRKNNDLKTVCIIKFICINNII